MARKKSTIPFSKRRIASYINNPPSTKSVCVLYPDDYTSRVHVTKHDDGKMLWIPSINTDPYLNSFCLKSVTSPVENVICTRCYAFNLLEGVVRSEKVGSLKWYLERNTRLLCSGPLGSSNFPIINHAGFVRYNSFGELINLQHLENLCDICDAYDGRSKVLPRATFSLFTKRNDIVRQYWRKYGKFPDNLILVYSTRFIDMDPSKVRLIEPFDKVFSVYSPEYAEEHGIVTNCEGRSCFHCRNCYSLDGDDFIYEIVRDPNVLKSMREEMLRETEGWRQ